MLQTFKTRSAKRLAVLAAPALAAVCALGLSAQQARAEFAEGDVELTLSASAQNDVNFNGFIFNAGGSIGYFFSDQFEGGLRQDFTYTDAGGPGSSSNGGTTVFVNYHFGDRGAQLQPFIGANIGYLYGDTINDTFAAGPEGGVKYFLSDDWFLYASIQYEFFFDNAGSADDNFNDGVFNYRLGIGVLLNR